MTSIYLVILSAVLSSLHSASCISSLIFDDYNERPPLRGTDCCDIDFGEVDFRGTNQYHAGESWSFYLEQAEAVNFQ
jgi:hypothetical protein